MQTDLIEAIWSFQEAQILATISNIQSNLKKNIQNLNGEYPMRNYFSFLAKDSYSVFKCLTETKLSACFKITENTTLST